MHFALIGKILGLLLMLFSFSMLPPVMVAYLYQDSGEMPFLTAFAIIFIAGMLLWLPFARRKGELQTRDGFLVVSLFWVVLAGMGTLPLLLSPALQINFTDAFFEAMSGLTTTGATVLTGIEDLPDSIRYYRQQLQWLGGMGIIILAIAILPMLGVGGMQLYKAEIPGPMKESKLTPRIAETAKALWLIYVVFTISCAILFYLAGMPWLEAIGHSFGTVATGGFAMYDASYGHYDDFWIDMIGAVFIFLCSVSFALHFAVWRGKTLAAYVIDPEFRFFVGLIVAYTVLVTVGLWGYGVYNDDVQTTVRHALFQALSFGTGTGFTSTNAADWPSFIPYLLVLASFIGGCAGSTASGMKTVRVALVVRQSGRELRRLIYPSGVFALRFGRHAVDDRVLQAVWGFVGVYISIAVVMTLLFLATGLDLSTAFSATAASLNNLGAGIAGIAQGFGDVSDIGKWIACLGMLLGRLEIFTVLVLFSPMFWKQ